MRGAMRRYGESIYAKKKGKDVRAAPDDSAAAVIRYDACVFIQGFTMLIQRTRMACLRASRRVSSEEARGIVVSRGACQMSEYDRRLAGERAPVGMARCQQSHAIASGGAACAEESSARQASAVAGGECVRWIRARFKNYAKVTARRAARCASACPIFCKRVTPPRHVVEERRVKRQFAATFCRARSLVIPNDACYAGCRPGCRCASVPAVNHESMQRQPHRRNVVSSDRVRSRLQRAPL